jgi:transposase
VTSATQKASVGVLTALGTAIKDLDRFAARRTPRAPRQPIFTSFPRAGLVNATQVRAELAEAAAYTGPDAIATLGRLVPVTCSSAKHRSVSFRWACTPYASSPAPGSASSGAAGSTNNPTTTPGTRAPRPPRIPRQHEIDLGVDTEGVMPCARAPRSS